MKAELWRRWRAGESISVISRGLDKPPGSVFTVLKHHGGIAPRARTVRAGHLTVEEREAISRGISAGQSFRMVAEDLGRSVSTVSREVARNGGQDAYRAVAAQECADEQRRRPKPTLLARNRALRGRVVELLDQEWSPDQIAKRLRRDHPDDPEMTVSHVQLADRRTETVVAALIGRYALMHPALRRSLTWDRGMELADHRVLTAATDIEVFFAAPRSPWQRGTNENTNKLVRQYLPKGTNLSTYSQADLDAIADRLNNRPRKCLDYRTPAECVALTV